MQDSELIRQINYMKPLALSKLNRLPDGVITIRDKFIITAAWGPRVVTSRRRGLKISAYPEEVTAAKKLWVEWLKTPSENVKVVIAKKLAQARIDAALKNSGIIFDAEAVEPEPATPITQEEIEDILQEREELRLAKDFARADLLRDYLVSKGVQVADQKLVVRNI